MRAHEYFTDEQLKIMLRDKGISLPVPSAKREPVITAFNLGFSEGMDGHQASEIGLNAERKGFYRLGYEVGEICRKDFLVEGIHPPLILAANRADIAKVRIRLVNLVKVE